MSYHEYMVSQKISADDPPFYALIMAAMRQADTDNTVLLKRTWPHVWDELDRRYHAPNGVLPEEDMPQGDRRGTKPDRRQRDMIVSNERREEGRDRRDSP